MLVNMKSLLNGTFVLQKRIWSWLIMYHRYVPHINTSRFTKNRSKQSTHDVYMGKENANIANVQVCQSAFQFLNHTTSRCWIFMEFMGSKFSLIRFSYILGGTINGGNYPQVDDSECQMDDSWNSWFGVPHCRKPPYVCLSALAHFCCVPIGASGSFIQPVPTFCSNSSSDWVARTITGWWLT